MFLFQNNAFSFTMKNVSPFIKNTELKLLKKVNPTWVSPMLATLHKKPFSAKNWIYECKFDGIRALIYCDNKHCKIMSRNEIDLTKNYPELLIAFQKLNIK